MTDEQALQELLRDSEGDVVFALTEGFYAGLSHARAWIELTQDPETWPQPGTTVLCRHRSGNIYLLKDERPDPRLFKSYIKFD